MSDTVKIDRLRIRVPKTRASEPKRLAADIANQLAKNAIGWNPKRLDNVRATAKQADAPSIATAIDRAVRSR